MDSKNYEKIVEALTNNAREIAADVSNPTLSLPSSSVFVGLYGQRHLQNRRAGLITDTPIIKIVVHPITLDILPLALLCIIFLSLATFMSAMRIGTATIALITAAYTRAFIITGWIPIPPQTH
jgi:hypothetical protein